MLRVLVLQSFCDARINFGARRAAGAVHGALLIALLVDIDELHLGVTGPYLDERHAVTAPFCPAKRLGAPRIDHVVHKARRVDVTRQTHAKARATDKLRIERAIRLSGRVRKGCSD